MPLAMCGVVIPIKAIGPVKAVVVPASNAVSKMTKMRSLLTKSLVLERNFGLVVKRSKVL